MLAEQLERLGQDVVKVERVRNVEALLVLLVQLVEGNEAQSRISISDEPPA